MSSTGTITMRPGHGLEPYDTTLGRALFESTLPADYSDRFGHGYDLPPLLPGTRVHWGFGVALLVIAVTWFVFSKTPVGLQLRAAGQAPEAAAMRAYLEGLAAWRRYLIL